MDLKLFLKPAIKQLDKIILLKSIVIKGKVRRLFMVKIFVKMMDFKRI